MNKIQKYVDRLTREWKQHKNIIIGVDFDDTISPWGLNTTQECNWVIEKLKTYQQQGAYITINTACVINGKLIEIFKDPITDDGTKKSKKGLLKVCYDGSMETYTALGKPADGTIKPIICKDQQTWEQEQTGLLTTVFKDGVLIKTTNLEEIRNKLNN
jgi:hypothetical protein